MAWTAVFTRHNDEAEARAQGAQLGIVFPADGAIPSGNQRYALVANIGVPWQSEPVYGEEGDVLAPGVRDPEGGYWCLLAINEAWEGHDAVIAAIEHLGVRRAPAHPPVVWA